MKSDSHKETYVTQLEELMPLIREQLMAGKSVKLSPRGISMLPMLRQGIDSVVLSPMPQRLKKYDLPLYQRSDGKFILHRVVEIGDTYTCIGDNQFIKESGLRHEQMIGVVTKFYRDSKEHSVNEFAYRVYCWFWHYSRPLRHFYRRGLRWISRKIKL